MSDMSKTMVLLVLLSVSFLGGHHAATNAAAVKLAQAEAAQARAQEQHEAAMAAASEAARLHEQVLADRYAQQADQFEKERVDAKLAADRTIADLRAGNLRLRDQWATQRLATAAAARAGEPGAAADGCAGVALDLFRAVDPIVQRQDAQIRGLQALLKAEREP